MSPQRLQRRLLAVRDRIDPAPDPNFIAYAQALIEFGGSKPTTETAKRLAQFFLKGRKIEPFACLSSGAIRR